MDIRVVGDEPLADGMRISVRLRRDFVVTDAESFLRSVRGAYVEMTPGATRGEAAQTVACAADAMCTFLERAE